MVEAAFNDLDLVPGLISVEDQSYLPEDESHLLAPHTLKAMLAVERAWAKANLGQQRNFLRGKDKKFRDPRAAVVAGTITGSLGLFDFSIPHIFDHYTSSKIRGNALAAPIAIRFGLGAGDFSLSAASATGGQALWMGANLIKMGVADIVVVVCVELMSPFIKNVLSAMGVLSISGTARPLTFERDGMRPVESAVALVLESEEHAKKRQHTPLARWICGSVKNECYHLLAPEPNTAALREAVIDSLKFLKGDLSKIDWISLHATGTKVWDALEIKLIKELFGKKPPHLSAFKRTFGHGRSTACLIAVAMIAEGLEKNRLPVLPQDIDPNFNLDLSLVHNTKASYAMHWSAGMGGTIAVNLFEPWQT